MCSENQDLLSHRQRLRSTHCRSTKFLLEQDVCNSAFTKSLLLINVLCILVHLQENPAFYLEIHDPLVLSFCTFIKEGRPSIYSGA